MRTYSELIKMPTLEERFKYLKLGGRVGDLTFGSDRYLNQLFYTSDEWRKIRDFVIVRDNANDLAVVGFEIAGTVFIHHMNPISVEDILQHSEFLIDPEFLVCCSKRTHDAIHYSDESLLPKGPVERFQNDTCPWKKG